MLQSLRFQNGAPFKGQEALVAGFGHSGGEIAIDLCEHDARPSFAVRGPVNVIPRELLGIPIVAIAGLEGKQPGVELVDGSPCRRYLAQARAAMIQP